MYKIKENNIVKENLQLERMGKTLSLVIYTNFYDVVKRYRDAEQTLISILNKEYKNTKEFLVDADYAIKNMMAVVFGEENAEKILSFYGENCMEALSCTISYIDKVFKKGMQKVVKQRKKYYTKQTNKRGIFR